MPESLLMLLDGQPEPASEDVVHLRRRQLQMRHEAQELDDRHRDRRIAGTPTLRAPPIDAEDAAAPPVQKPARGPGAFFLDGILFFVPPVGGGGHRALPGFGYPRTGL